MASKTLLATTAEYTSQREKSSRMIPCGLCSRDFGDLQALNQHLKISLQHASCKRCQRGFASSHALKQHLQTSGKHKSYGQSAQDVLKNDLHVNAQSPKILFQLQTPSSTLDNSHDYTGIPRSEVDTVFKLARKLLPQLSPDMIIQRTQTKLSRDIVCALIDATYRLLPLDNSPEGVKARQQKQNDRTERALHAEQNFLKHLSELGYQFLDERQQRQQQVGALTPDIVFPRPTLVNGHLCRWVEYKDYFGFRANPYVASHEKKQFKKYVTGIGLGAVIYKLGFEVGYPSIEGVEAFRELEAVQSLCAQ